MIPVMQNTLKDQLPAAKHSTEKNMSENSDLDSNVVNLKEWFRKMGYPEQLINTQVAPALPSASNKSATNSKQGKESGVLLVTTYHSRLKDLNSWTKKELTIPFCKPRS